MNADDMKENLPLNIKPRSVKCINCKLESITDDPSPKCPDCGYMMYTIVIGKIE